MRAAEELAEEADFCECYYDGSHEFLGGAWCECLCHVGEATA